MFEGLLNIFCPAVARLGHFVDAASADCDERKLGRNEECIQCDEQQDETEAGPDFTGAKVFGGTLQEGQEIHITEIYIVEGRN